MEYWMPDYYDTFQCVADQCEDTCCAGWQIMIDPESLDRYKKESGDFKGRIEASVQWEEGCFRQLKDRRCAFLNEQNLCDLYSALGKESLCTTCKRYPRHVEEFEGVREITLSISCPEVAKMILEKEEPVTFYTEEREEEEELFDDFDPFLYSMLADAREVLLDILQNRKKSVPARMKLAVALVKELQIAVDTGELFCCEEILEKYRTKGETLILDPIKVSPRKAFRCLYSLEMLKPEWGLYVQEAEKILFQNGALAYKAMEIEFREWWKEKMPEWNIQEEQLLVYFVSTYFCGAAYDGDLEGKLRLSIYSVYVIYQLLLAKWIRNDWQLEKEEVVDLVYRYSREIEHSDVNLERLQECVEEFPLFSCENM